MTRRRDREASEPPRGAEGGNAVLAGGARFSDLLELTEQGILVADPQTRRFISSNAAMSQMLGFGPEELRQMGVEDIHPPEVLESVVSSFDSLAQGRKFLAPAIPLRRRDGSILYADVVASPVAIHGRALIAGFFTDVTERVRTEEALRLSENRYRELFDHIGTCVAVYEARDGGEDFAFVDFNKAAERAEAIARSSVVGKSILEVFPAVREFGLFDVFQRVWRTGEPEHHPIAEYRDERIRGWRENYVFRLPSGEVVAVYEDITERKRTEDALRKSEALYHAVLDTIPDAVTLADLDGTLTLVSRHLAELHGYEDPRELIGKDGLELCAPEDRRRAADTLARGAAATEGAIGQFELRLQRKDGSQFWGELRATLLLPPAVPAPSLLTVVRDITARKQTEEALRDSAQRLRGLAARLAEAQEVERRRISRELHDQVGQNLTALGMKLESLSRALADGNEATQLTLRAALALVGESIRSLRIAMTDLRPSILDDYGLSAALHSHATWFRAPESLAVTIEAPTLTARLPQTTVTALFRIAQEALANVVKHAHATSVAVRLREEDGVIRLEIEDNGVGFAPETLAAGGAHWGQEIMRERAEAVGAKVTILSQPGRGTRVAVELPQP